MLKSGKEGFQQLSCEFAQKGTQKLCRRQQGTTWDCATVVVISHRAPSPKLLDQLPGISDALTQIELRKEDVAVQVAAAGE